MESVKTISVRRRIFALNLLVVLPLFFLLQPIQAQENQTDLGAKEGSGFTAYLPIAARRLPYVTLYAISHPNAANQWTLNWSVDNSVGVTGYVIQESKDANFDVISNTFTTTEMSYTVTETPTWQNVFYYRVRATGAWTDSPYSNVAAVAGAYRDDFSDSASGWAMRRQDTDDTDNQVYYRNGRLVLEMDSSWDYQLASPLAPAPGPDYVLRMRTRLKGVDNLHAYGMVFGADWNRDTCPNADYSSCFNHYYRLLIVWHGASNKLLMQLKRIDTHNPGNNTGSGTELISWRDVTVSSPSEEFQTWQVNVSQDGTISIYVNGNFVRSVVDATYIDSPYWGVFSATDEYNGLEAETDWFEVLPR